MERELSRDPALVPLADLFAGPVPAGLSWATSRRRFGIRRVAALVLVVLAMTAAVVGVVLNVAALSGAPFLAVLAAGVVYVSGPAGAWSHERADALVSRSG